MLYSPLRTLYQILSDFKWENMVCHQKICFFKLVLCHVSKGLAIHISAIKVDKSISNIV